MASRINKYDYTVVFRNYRHSDQREESQFELLLIYENLPSGQDDTILKIYHNKATHYRIIRKNN